MTGPLCQVSSETCPPPPGLAGWPAFRDGMNPPAGPADRSGFPPAEALVATTSVPPRTTATTVAAIRLTLIELLLCETANGDRRPKMVPERADAVNHPIGGRPLTRRRVGVLELCDEFRRARRSNSPKAASRRRRPPVTTNPETPANPPLL